MKKLLLMSVLFIAMQSHAASKMFMQDVIQKSCLSGAAGALAGVAAGRVVGRFGRIPAAGGAFSVGAGATLLHSGLPLKD